MAWSVAVLLPWFGVAHNRRPAGDTGGDVMGRVWALVAEHGAGMGPSGLSQVPPPPPHPTHPPHPARPLLAQVFSPTTRGLARVLSLPPLFSSPSPRQTGLSL